MIKNIKIAISVLLNFMLAVEFPLLGTLLMQSEDSTAKIAGAIVSGIGFTWWAMLFLMIFFIMSGTFGKIIGFFFELLFPYCFEEKEPLPRKFQEGELPAYPRDPGRLERWG